jgi:hypothetical protein
MTGAAAAQVDRGFFIPALAVDDHREEMVPFTRGMKKWNVRPRLFETAFDWARLARKADADTILISDNFLPGVNDFDTLGVPDVETSQGEEAGLGLLTTFCDRLGIQAGLKILLTQFPLRPEAKAFLGRRNKDKKKEVLVFKKNNPAELEGLDRVVRNFSRERRAKFIKLKLDYIRELGDDWGFSELETAKLFSLQDNDDVVWIAASSGTTSLDFERRCDLIYRVKLNLAAVYGGENPVQEASWWRTRLAILGGRSPLEYVSTQGIEQLYSLVSVMEGNH